jgi:integrase
VNSLNPFPAPTRTSKTEEVYLKEGERHLRRARRLFPEITCPAKALVAVRESQPVLKARTARRYWQEHLTILGKLRQTNEISEDVLVTAQAAIGAALFDSRQRPSAPRTGAKKVRNLTRTEAAVLIEALAQKVQGPKADDIDRYLLLYARLAPSLGFRPCEGIGIQIAGAALLVPCAKNSNGRAGRDTRGIDLRDAEAGFLHLVAEFISVQRSLIEAKGDFDTFYHVARQRLARLSIRVINRRICPYSFRHVAMATWKAAGYDAATIALLAGHSSKVTAGKHYAGKSKGWTADFAFVAPAEVPAIAADEAAMPTNTESSVEATKTNEVHAPTAGLGAISEPNNPADEEAERLTKWDMFFETSSLPTPPQISRGIALWGRRRDPAHPEAYVHPMPSSLDLDPVGIPAHADLGEPDAADALEEDAGLGMTF